MIAEHKSKIKKLKFKVKLAKIDVNQILHSNDASRMFQNEYYLVRNSVNKASKL